MINNNKTLNEIQSNRSNVIIECDVELNVNIDDKYKRTTVPDIPNISESTLLRHYTNLSRKNYALSTTMYPLGSCTMKHNPLVNEKIAKYDGFSSIHPYQDEESMQGSLEVMYELQKALCEICGMDYFTLQPAAGAHGEYTGLLIIAQYFKNKKDPVSEVFLYVYCKNKRLPVIAHIIFVVIFHIVKIGYSTKIIEVQVVSSTSLHWVTVNTESKNLESWFVTVVNAALNNTMFSIRTRWNYTSKLFPARKSE